MKHLNYLMVSISLLLMFSCSKDEPVDDGADISKNVAVLYLGPLLDEINDSRQQVTPDCSTDEPAFAQIMLTYGESNTPVSVVVEIMEDENGLFTAYDSELEIPVTSGNNMVSITLTDFIVWNDNNGSPGIPIWIAPKEGSDYARFVDQPVGDNFTFNLRAGSKNYVNVDVICFDDRDVNLYGYQFFDINPVPLSEFCVFANFCIGGRDYAANYSFDLYLYSGDEEEANPMTNLDLYTAIYTDEIPNTDYDNDAEVYYADPLCMAIPNGDPENGNAPYLYYEITLTDWPGYYGTAPNVTQSGYLTYNQILALLDVEGDDNNSTVDYLHFKLNCPGGEDPLCQIDSDGDTIPDCDDECPGYDDRLDADDDGVADGCDICMGDDPDVNYDDNLDTDGDGIPDGCDACPTRYGEAPNGCEFDEPCIGIDTDGDGIFGDCDICEGGDDTIDTDGDGIPDFCDDDTECQGPDEDGDGILESCDCDDDNFDLENLCDEPGTGECGQTAYMWGDLRFSNVPNASGNNWGWIDNFEITGEITTVTNNIYAGASTQYNLNDQTKIGEVVVEFNDTTNELKLTFDFDNGDQELAVVHVDIREENRTQFNPGQYNQTKKYNVGDGDVLTYTYDNPDTSFKLIVHGEDACKDAAQ